jgi:hypothetical protein
MKPLASDEKLATVMVYTHYMFVRGEIVVKENLRASIWLRTQNVLNYMHLLKPNVLLFTGAQPKSLSYNEMFVSIKEVIAFHIAPPAEDTVDFDTSELNRVMQFADLMLGSFTLKGKIRISTQSDLATNLDVSHATWMSVYDADISNMYLPQFNMHVPMLLVNPSTVSFGIG